jgi:hypothetical protein
MTASVLLAAGLLLQAAEPRPLIDNARVRVWEHRVPAGVFEFDTVLVSAAGQVRFLNRGAPAEGDRLAVGIKPAQVTPLANTSGYPLAMQRPGARQLLDNERVTVWDYTWTPNVPTPMHFHDKDVVVMFLGDGDLKSTTAAGEVTVNQYTAGAIRFNARDRVHTEELVRGAQRAIIIELK